MKKVVVFTYSEWDVYDFFLITDADEDNAGALYRDLRAEFVDTANLVLKKHEVFNRNEGLLIRFHAWGRWDNCTVGLNEGTVRMTDLTQFIRNYVLADELPEIMTDIQSKFVEIWPEIEDAFAEAGSASLGPERLCEATRLALHQLYRDSPDKYLDLVKQLADTIKSARDHPEAQMIADDLISQPK